LTLSTLAEKWIEQFGEDLPDFERPADLKKWLQTHFN
jgi:hypothetical protein